MARLVALKKVRYPRGPDGKEYDPGQEFDSLSDIDTKRLTLLRVAKPVEEPAPPRRGRPPKVQTADLTAEPQSEPVAEPHRYLRRDMVPGN